MLCKNPLGRLEFNQNRVRNHYFQTLSRLEIEKQQEEFDNDLLTIECLLSTIISQIEVEENEILPLLNSLVSSIDDIPKELTLSPSIIFSSNIKTPLSNSKTLLTKENSILTQRACQTKSLIRCKTSTSPSSSITMISTELS